MIKTWFSAFFLFLLAVFFSPGNSNSTVERIADPPPAVFVSATTLTSYFGVTESFDGVPEKQKFNSWELHCEKSTPTSNCTLEISELFSSHPTLPCLTRYNRYSSEENTLVVENLDLARGVLDFSWKDDHGGKYHSMLRFNDTQGVSRVSDFVTTGGTPDLFVKNKIHSYEARIPEYSFVSVPSCAFLVSGYKNLGQKKFADLLKILPPADRGAFLSKHRKFNECVQLKSKNMSGGNSQSEFPEKVKNCLSGMAISPQTADMLTKLFATEGLQEPLANK